MRIDKNKLILLIVLTFSSAVTSAGSTSDSTLGINCRLQGYLDNLEYDNRYLEGQTYFGANFDAHFYYQPASFARFAAGVYLLRRFGDHAFSSIARPVLQAGVTLGDFQVLLGSLENRTNHAMPDIIYKKESMYDPGYEEGGEVFFSHGPVFEDLWINWAALNTPSQREHFTAASSTALCFNPISIPLFLIADHHGGQQFAPEGDPVRENYCGAAGIVYASKSSGLLSGLGGSLLALGSATRVRDEGMTFQNGWGIRAEVNAFIVDFNLAFHWFTGENFRSETGNPLYQSSAPVYSFDITRSYAFNRNIVINGGMQFDVLGTNQHYFDNPEYRWWLTITGMLDRKF